MGVLKSKAFRGLVTAITLTAIAIAALPTLECSAQSSVEPGQYYLTYHVAVDTAEPRLRMEGDVKIYVVVKEPGIAYLVNAAYSNVEVHEAAEEISEEQAGALLITLITDFIEVWLNPPEIPENGVVTSTSGAFRIRATYDKPTGFLTHAEYSMKPGSNDVVVNLVNTNVPGLTPTGGGGLGLLPLLAGIGIAVAAVAVVVFIIRSKKLGRPRSTYAPLPPPPPPPG